MEKAVSSWWESIKSTCF